MSKPKRKGDSLPSLQKRIVLNLAKNDPQTINETVEKIRSHYKPSWIAFGSLQEKGIIKKIDAKTYRGREYPRFWLTDEGVVVAMIEGAPPKDLLQKVEQLYPNNEILQYCLEIGPKLSREVFRIGLTAIRNKGKLEPIDMATILLTQAETNTHIEKFKEAMGILKKYPKEHRRLKEQVERMLKELAIIENML